jgi:hypothetical protein
LKLYVPRTGSERNLASGRMLTPGETFDLSAEEAKDPHNQRLIEEGHLLKVEKKKEETKDA